MSFFTKFVYGSRKYSARFFATSHTRETLGATLTLQNLNFAEFEKAKFAVMQLESRTPNRR